MISYQRLFDRLESSGLTSYKLRKMKDPIIAQATLTRLKKGIGGIDSNTLNRICKYFDCQPGDLMEYIPDDQNYISCFTIHEPAVSLRKRYRS